MLVAPEFLLNFWKVLVFPSQGLCQRPGAAGRPQVFGFIGVVTALLLIGIDVDGVQASKEQQQRQNDNDWGIKIAVRHNLLDRGASRNADEELAKLLHYVSEFELYVTIDTQKSGFYCKFCHENK